MSARAGRASHFRMRWGPHLAFEMWEPPAPTAPHCSLDRTPALRKGMRSAQQPGRRNPRLQSSVPSGFGDIAFLRIQSRVRPHRSHSTVSVTVVIVAVVLPAVPVTVTVYVPAVVPGFPLLL